MHRQVVPSQPHSRKKRPLNRLWALLILGAVIMFFSLPMFQCAVWDGHFPLALDVRSETGRRIEEVEFMSFFKRDVAEWIAENPDENVDWTPDPTTRESGIYLASVHCSGQLWLFNIELDYTEPRYIVLDVAYTDGNSIRKAAKIPPGRGRRSLKVIVP